MYSMNHKNDELVQEERATAEKEVIIAIKMGDRKKIEQLLENEKFYFSERILEKYLQETEREFKNAITLTNIFNIGAIIKKYIKQKKLLLSNFDKFNNRLQSFKNEFMQISPFFANDEKRAKRESRLN